jgi:hypothetical protein
MVLVAENKPADIARRLAVHGFVATQVLRRRARNEDLAIWR